MLIDIQADNYKAIEEAAKKWSVRSKHSID